MKKESLTNFQSKKMIELLEKSMKVNLVNRIMPSKNKEESLHSREVEQEVLDILDGKDD